MPNIKSAIKRVEIAERNRRRNMGIKSAIRTAVKKAVQTIESKSDATAIQESLNRAFSTIDRAVLKGVIHKNTAARYKARLSKAANKVA